MKLDAHQPPPPSSRMTKEIKTYGFWDGDFTFHAAEYDLHLPVVFRVRIDSSPEERAIQNVKNTNVMSPNWKRIRPATNKEIEQWFSRLVGSYPLRKPQETMGLKYLRDAGRIREEDVFPLLSETLEALTEERTMFDNFQSKDVHFVRKEQTETGYEYFLTKEGHRLVSLMR